jgi:hypothetical protein
MKKTKLISLLFMSLVAAKSFAFSTFTSSAHVCNKTQNTTFHFQLNYKHDADVNTPNSYDFVLSPGSCNTIGFYMQTEDSDLMFTDLNNSHNSFHIKNRTWASDLVTHGVYIDVEQFHMHEYQLGSGSDYIEGNADSTEGDNDLYFTLQDYVDNPPANSLVATKDATNQSNTQSKKPAPIAQTSVRFW